MNQGTREPESQGFGRTQGQDQPTNLKGNAMIGAVRKGVSIFHWFSGSLIL